MLRALNTATPSRMRPALSTAADASPFAVAEPNTAPVLATVTLAALPVAARVVCDTLVKSPVANLLVLDEVLATLVPCDVALTLPSVVTAVPDPAPTVPAIVAVAAPPFEFADTAPNTRPVVARSTDAAPPIGVDVFENWLLLEVASLIVRLDEVELVATALTLTAPSASALPT